MLSRSGRRPLTRGGFNTYSAEAAGGNTRNETGAPTLATGKRSCDGGWEHQTGTGTF